MAVDDCPSFCKCLLTLFNKIVQAVGIVLFVLGLWLKNSESTKSLFRIQDLDSSDFVKGVVLLMGLGSVMVIVASIGDYAILKGKKTVLKLFAVLLAILIVVELAVGGVVYHKCEEFGKFLAAFYTKVAERYKLTRDPDVAGILLIVHSKLECCGVEMPHGMEPLCKGPTLPCTKYFEDLFSSRILMVLGILGIGAVLIAAMVCTIILLRRPVEPAGCMG